jgi:hypothetical protein
MKEIEMKKALLSSLAFLLVIGVAVSAFAWPSVYPTGTTIYNPAKVYNGYTLFTAGHVKAAAVPYESPAVMYLINMNGEVVHTWKLPFEAHHGELKPNGNLVVICADNKAVPGRPGVAPFRIGGHMGWLYELDWDGNIVFQHYDPTMHHDFSQMKNGNYLYLGWEQIPKGLQKKIRGGVKGTEHKGGIMWGTTIKEVNLKGEIVWTWSAVKNWDPKLDIMGPIYSRNEWGHANSLDEMDNGDVVFDAKHTDTVYIVDKNSGNIKWRWGSLAYLDEKTDRIEYKKRGAPDTLGGQHCAHEITAGLPGAGNILLYDNGMHADKSRAVEVDPKTNKVVWETKSSNRGDFSRYISGAERQPNGNTLITSGATGRLYEVTKKKEIVWEYIHDVPHIFRSHRYAPDFAPQLKNLPPAEGPAVQLVDPKRFKMPASAPKPIVN